MNKRKIKIEVELETEEFQSIPLLTQIVKFAVEKMFFSDVKVNNVRIEEIINDKSTEGI